MRSCGQVIALLGVLVLVAAGAVSSGLPVPTIVGPRVTATGVSSYRFVEAAWGAKTRPSCSELVFVDKASE